MQPTPLAARAMRPLGLLVCLWFFSATFYAAWHIELGFDPAYHASVAKNFANGEGWISHYETAVPFNPDVTTGPALLLPASAFIALFGHQRWVPAVAAASVQLLVLLLILLRLRRLLASAEFWPCAILLCVVFSLHGHSWWLTLTADFLVFLLSLLAVLLLIRQPGESAGRQAFAAGLALGLALLAKALAWFAWLGLAVYGLWRLSRGACRREACRQAAALLLGAALPVLPWTLYESQSLRDLDPAMQAEHAAYASRFFRGQGSGITELADSPRPVARLGDNLRRNSRLLLEHLHSRTGLPAALSLALLASLIVFALRALRRPEDPWQRRILLLGLIGGGQLLWFLLLSASWNAKYALAPVSLALVVLALQLGRRLRSPWLLTPLLVLPLLMPATSRANLQQLLLFQGGPSAYTRDQLATLDFLQRLDTPLPLAGCGWVFAPWDFEYLLPGSGHFRDCRRLIAAALEELPAGSAGPHLRWSGQPEFLLVSSHIFWEISAYRDRYEPVRRACAERPLLRRQYFSVFHCRFPALARELALTADSPFRPSANRSRFVHKPAPIE